MLPQIIHRTFFYPLKSFSFDKCYIYKYHNREYIPQKLADLMVNENPLNIADYIALINKNIIEYHTTAIHHALATSIAKIIISKTSSYSPTEIDKLMSSIIGISKHYPIYQQILDSFKDDYKMKPISRTFQHFECKLYAEGVNDELLRQLPFLNPRRQLEVYQFAQKIEFNIDALHTYFKCYHLNNQYNESWFSIYASLVPKMPLSQREFVENGLSNIIKSHTIRNSPTIEKLLINYYPIVKDKPDFIKGITHNLSEQSNYYGLGMMYLDMYKNAHNIERTLKYNLDNSICGLNTRKFVKFIRELNQMDITIFADQVINSGKANVHWVTQSPIINCNFHFEPKEQYIPLLRILYLHTMQKSDWTMLMSSLSNNDKYLFSCENIMKAVQSKAVEVDPSISLKLLYNTSIEFTTTPILNDHVYNLLLSRTKLKNEEDMKMLNYVINIPGIKLKEQTRIYLKNIISKYNQNKDELYLKE